MKLRLFVFPQNYILFIFRTRPTLEGFLNIYSLPQWGHCSLPWQSEFPNLEKAMSIKGQRLMTVLQRPAILVWLACSLESTITMFATALSKLSPALFATMFGEDILIARRFVFRPLSSKECYCRVWPDLHCYKLWRDMRSYRSEQ